MIGVSTKEARRVLDLDGAELREAMAEANRLREQRHGNEMSLCWIVNARSGNCSEDCAFCAQSSRSDADAPRYPLLGVDEICHAASQAAAGGAHRFSIVTSGRQIKPGEDLETIKEAIKRVKRETGLEVCASLGCVEREVLIDLKSSGLSRYHHNIETARSLWSEICTTRPYDDSLRVIRQAAKIGIEVCSGGIFGLGESLDQRIELLAEIRDLDVDSVALNFFVPVKGTPLEAVRGLTPSACLGIVAAARLMMPQKEIRICGGRERNVRDLQARLPLAGASGLMIGGYLTTPGRPVDEDLRMIRDLGLVPAIEPRA